MEIQPSLLSYIFAGSTKWCINYEFPELTLELDGAIVKLNPEEVLKSYIHKGWMWSTVTLKTQDQNYPVLELF
jgi:DNA helicase-4